MPGHRAGERLDVDINKCYLSMLTGIVNGLVDQEAMIC